MGQPFGQVTPSPKNTLSDRNGHHGEILCLAASEDGKWLVSGGRDKIVGVWNVEGESAKWLVGLRGHKDAITVCTINKVQSIVLITVAVDFITAIGQPDSSYSYRITISTSCSCFVVHSICH